MLLYLTSNKKCGLMDEAVRQMEMPVKKLVGKFSLKSFVTKDMRNYTTQKFFAVGEALAHLDHLEAQGRVFRQETHGKRVYFAGVGDII